MKQLVQNFRSGDLLVEDVPCPVVRPGSVLVRNAVSLISSGTEGGTVALGKMNLLQKARARPEQVRKVLNVVRNDGVLAAYSAVTKTLEIPIPLGYSCTGEVVEVGSGITDLTPGTRVACGGAGLANHAEVVAIPRNLVVPVPDGVRDEEAAFTTLGSIAMQSVRIADTRVGEDVVVIGLGLVGLITCQILRASGCNVLGIDVDAGRVSWAAENGFCRAALRSQSNLEELVRSMGSGYGADAVIVTAATSSNDPVALAGDLARFRGRVVVVGRTRMEAPRETFLFKELELCTSLAYGPGTGDPEYELAGSDYPIGYVRWTENRNMQAFLGLVDSGAVDLGQMVTHEFAIDQAEEAFETIAEAKGSSTRGVLLRYPTRDVSNEPDPALRREISLSRRSDGQPGSLRVAVLGAGSFAANFIVPMLHKTKGLEPTTIVSANGMRAKALAAKYDIPTVGSDAYEAIQRDDVDGVLILTRHDSHAPLAIAALDAGKHVFVEKPPAMTREQLEELVRAAERAPGLLQVGFNRRFAPLAGRLRKAFDNRGTPMSITYRSNVGYRPPEHWLHDPVEGGGVLLGEAVHFVDFAIWLTGSLPRHVNASCLTAPGDGLVDGDSAHITLELEDGSIATVIYVSNGDPAAGREQLEVHCDNATAFLEDFRSLRIVRNGRSKRTRRTQDRGHRAQLTAMAESWHKGEQVVDLRQSMAATLATLRALESIAAGRRLDVDWRALFSQREEQQEAS